MSDMPYNMKHKVAHFMDYALNLKNKSQKPVVKVELPDCIVEQSKILQTANFEVENAYDYGEVKIMDIRNRIACRIPGIKRNLRSSIRGRVNKSE